MSRLQEQIEKIVRLRQNVQILINARQFDQASRLVHDLRREELVLCNRIIDAAEAFDLALVPKVRME